MDTREKIMTLAAFAERKEPGVWTALIGVFDPFTVKVARAIRGHAGQGRELLVVVVPGVGTLLSAEARAALMASLRDVTAVVIAAPQDARATLEAFGGIEIFEDAAADRRRSQEFVEFVLERQASALRGNGRG
jgi:hypothetical protein